MKNTFPIIFGLILLSFSALAQVKIEESSFKSPTKQVENQSTINEGTLMPSKKTNQPNSIMPQLGESTAPSSSAKFTSASQTVTTDYLPEWSSMSPTEQINFLNKELERLNESQAEALQINKLEKLLERKKLENSLQKD